MQRNFPTSAHLEVVDGCIRSVCLEPGPISEGVWELNWSGVSPFARRVYEAMLDLGVGQTVTYGELAKRIGCPGAARAVGRACARNPFPLVVPCHRVVSAKGVGGFAFGCALKKRLLAYEGALAEHML